MKCEICKRDFKNAKSLTNHRRWHDLPQYKEFQKKFKSIISERNENSKNGLWKGDDVGYHALHTWVRRRKEKPDECKKCNSPPFDLANISGKYKRDINDYQWLCRSCHMKEDGRLFNMRGGKYRKV